MTGVGFVDNCLQELDSSLFSIPHRYLGMVFHIKKKADSKKICFCESGGSLLFTQVYKLFSRLKILSLISPKNLFIFYWARLFSLFWYKKNIPIFPGCRMSCGSILWVKRVAFVYTVYKIPFLFERTSSCHLNSAFWSLHQQYQSGLGSLPSWSIIC